MQTQFDVIVVGAGPAGVSAALTLRNRGKSVLMCMSDGGALMTARQVDNYPGMPHVSGPDMVRMFHDQCRDAGVEMYPHAVRQMLSMGDSVSVMAGDMLFTARCVLLSVGVVRKSRIPGESDYAGMGVSYCATCDGMLYRGKKIAVISAYEAGVEEANFLASIAGQTLYFAEKAHNAATLSPSVTVISDRVTRIQGENGRVTGVMAGDTLYPADGVFILRPATPPDQMAPGLNVTDGRIVVNERFETNLPRIYAAGDCVGAPYQIAKAMGEGNVAALHMAALLEKA